MSTAAWGLDFTDPLCLVALILLGPVAVFHLLSLADATRRRRRLSLVCRSLTIVLIVLALAGLSLVRPDGEPCVVFAVDRSASVGEVGRKAVEDFLNKVPARGKSMYLSFAARPGTVRVERSTGGTLPEGADVNGTDIAAAIEVAAAAVPPGFVPRVVLLTDGLATAGDARAAAFRAGVPLWTVPLPAGEDPQVQVAEVIVPEEEVREGAPFRVKIVVTTNHDDEVELRVTSNNRRINVEGLDGRKKVAAPGRTFDFSHRLTGDRRATIAATARALRDTNFDDNTARGVVNCTGKPRLLAIDSDPRAARPLAEALGREGLDVDPPQPPEALPDSLDKLARYDLVILSNVPMTHPDMTPRKVDSLKTYVRDLGGGLLVIGGDRSFGPGGYARSGLDDLLPLASDFKSEREKPSLSMVLVIDKSGSMNDEGKLGMAQEAARTAVELLGPKDQVGILAFDTAPQWASELQAAAEKGRIYERISGMRAEGGTSILPALKTAVEALAAGPPAKYKHIVLLTDGRDEPPIPAESYYEVLEQAAGARITVSTVGVGSDADRTLLKEIAARGHGKEYFTADPKQIPQIFAKETITAGNSAVDNQLVSPRVWLPAPVLDGLDWPAAPPLNGHVRTRLKPTAEQGLVADPGFEPLLAWWRTGLGMCTAFTSDAKNSWAEGWITDWPDGYSRFWAQVARHTMRNLDAAGAEIHVRRIGGRAEVTVDAAEPSGAYRNGAETRLDVIRDSPAAPVSVPLVQAAPGRYAGSFDARDEGVYLLTVSQSRDGQRLFCQTRGLAVGYPDEFRVRPPDEKLLEELARETGGRFRPDPETVFEPDDRTVPRREPLWPPLLAAAAVLLVIDVGLRRTAGRAAEWKG